MGLALEGSLGLSCRPWYHPHKAIGLGDVTHRKCIETKEKRNEDRTPRQLEALLFTCLLSSSCVLLV